eukprot:scaffold88437_cov84-Phaeocystis_antarctica.AAC.1
MCSRGAPAGGGAAPTRGFRPFLRIPAFRGQLVPVPRVIAWRAERNGRAQVIVKLTLIGKYFDDTMSLCSGRGLCPVRGALPPTLTAPLSYCSSVARVSMNLATSSRATEPPTVPEASATSYLVRGRLRLRRRLRLRLRVRLRVRVRARTSVRVWAMFRVRVRLRVRECHIVLALARRVAEAGGAHLIRIRARVRVRVRVRLRLRPAGRTTTHDTPLGRAWGVAPLTWLGLGLGLG